MTKKKTPARRSAKPEPLSNCIVVCSMQLGDVPESLLQAAPEAFLLAVDGGVGNLMDLGLKPSVWVGDGDSIPKGLKLEGFPKIRLPKAKDYSDLEFALNVAGQRFISGEWEGDLILLGAQGGRLDHEIINMIVAQNWLRELAEVVGTAACPEFVSIGQRGVWIATMRSAEFCQPRGRLFSVLTLDPELEVTITGAKYNVRKQKLGIGSLGLSNLGLGKDVKITATNPADARSGAQHGPVFVMFPG